MSREAVEAWRLWRRGGLEAVEAGRPRALDTEL
jgi:hypothetical protein